MPPNRTLAIRRIRGGRVAIHTTCGARVASRGGRSSRAWTSSPLQPFLLSILFSYLVTFSTLLACVRVRCLRKLFAATRTATIA